MTTKVQEKVKVLAAFDTAQLSVRPLKLIWNDTQYDLGKVDFFHITKNGLERVYHFSLCDTTGGIYFKLAFYTHTLTWWIEETEDGTGS